MIASLRGVSVLVAIALALGVVLIVAAPEQPEAVSRNLMGRYIGHDATGLVLAPAGKPAIELWRDKRTGWHVAGGHADDAIVDALFSALGGAKWHRRAPADVAGPLRGELRVIAGDQVETFAIGSELPGAEQTWLVHGGHALLVDTWVARALWPDPMTLRVRRPLAQASTAESVSGPAASFEGRRQIFPHTRWIAELAFADLAATLGDLTIISIDGIVPGPAGASIRIKPTPLESSEIVVIESGTCAGDRIYIESRVSKGCVDRVAWRRTVAAFEPFALDAPTFVDTRPVPFTPISLRFWDKTHLSLEGRPMLGTNEEADLDRVAELLAALSEPATLVPRPTGSPRTTLEATMKGYSSMKLEVFADLVARDGETFALRPSPQAMAVIARGASALRDPVLWREDATNLTALTVDGVTYTRGAVIGEWTREPAGKVDTAIVDALAQTLATVRGPAGVAPRAIAHRLALTFTPPAGAPTTHQLEMASPGTDGCAARVDGQPVLLALPICTLVVALAAAR